MICLWQADQLFAEAEGKSRYFAITEFNNNLFLFIRSDTEFVFYWISLGSKRSAIFTQQRSQEGEKHGFFTHLQNIICSQTRLDGIAHEQTIICRQLFAGYVVGSWPMKRKKNLLRMIIIIMLQYLLTLITMSWTMLTKADSSQIKIILQTEKIELNNA